LTPTELVFTFGGSYVCANFGEIDQEMRPWECSQTEWQTQTGFIICAMLYAIAMGQIKVEHQQNMRRSFGPPY